MKPFPVGHLTLPLFKLCFLLLLSCCTYAQEQEAPDHIASAASSFTRKPDSVFLRAKDLYHQATEDKDAVAQGLQLSIMGEICYHQGQYPKALAYYLAGRKQLEQSGRKDLLAALYNQMGTLYYYNHNQGQSASCFKTALQLYRSLKDQRGIAATLGHIGHLQEKKQQYDSAIRYQEQALKVYQGIGDSAGMARIYEHLGSVQEDLEHYEMAMRYFQNALNLYQSTGNGLATIEVVNNIGDIYRKTGRLREALQHSFTALQLAERYEERYQTSSAYRDISKTYHLIGKNDSAFYYAEISRAHLMAIYSIENNQQMSFLQALDDTERKNNEINILREEKKLTWLSTIAVIVVVLLLVIAAMLTISRQRLKLRAGQAANAQREELFQTEQMLMDARLTAATIAEEKLKAELRSRQLEKEKLNAELKNRQYEELELKQQIELKEKGLSTQVLHVIQKNQLLETLRAQLETIVADDKRDQKRQMRSVIQLINQNFNNDTNWEEFSHNFEHIHQSFFTRLHQLYPGLTAAELKLISLLKMNLDTGDMATMLGISPDSLRVARYRLRKKLNLDQGANLVSFLQSLPR